MRRLGHLGALGVFSALAVVWTWPLVVDLAGQLPGPGPGDNFTFLSSFWWMREAVSSGADFFQATHLFAPVGADLTLHTHLALPAFVGATLLASLPVAAALNITVLLSFVLNGWCTYWLAWRLTGDRAASLVAGFIFAASPFIAARLTGHFNLAAAWVIPLTAIAVLEGLRHQRAGARLAWMASAGVVAAAAMYIDYYLVIYAITAAIVIAVLTARDWSVTHARQQSRLRRAASTVALTLVAIQGLLIVAIAMTGGFAIEIGALRVSARNLFNPLQIFWVLCAIALALRFFPRISSAPRDGWRMSGAGVALAFVTFLAASAPILLHAASLVRRGDYVTQQSHWRSAPKGIDTGTLVAGNPFHPAIGARVHALYERTDINPIENSGWLGIVPIVLAVIAIRRHEVRADALRWAIAGGAFFVWSLGHHLMVFGQSTGMTLPAALFRYVPVLNNARMPGRAIVVAYLALAMLAAFALRNWRPRGGGSRSIALVGIAAAIAVDYLPAPFPMTRLDAPQVYSELRDRPEQGAVCELPLGIRDGFGGRGRIDDRIFLYQTIHRRPLVGGFLARLPPSILDAYERDPLLMALLRLSEGQSPDRATLPDRFQATEAFNRIGIAFVVVNQAAASPAMMDYVTQVLPVRKIASDDTRIVFVTAETR